MRAGPGGAEIGGGNARGGSGLLTHTYSMCIDSGFFEGKLPVPRHKPENRGEEGRIISIPVFGRLASPLGYSFSAFHPLQALTSLRIPMAEIP